MLGSGPEQAAGGTDGLGVLVVADSIEAVLWPPLSSGSTDGFSIPASVDDVVDVVIWSTVLWL